MNKIKKNNNEYATLSSTLEYKGGDVAIYELCITSTSSRYDNKSFAQMVLNFLYTYQDIYMIEIDEIYSNRMPDDSLNYDDKDDRIWLTKLGFHPTSVQSSFYSGFLSKFFNEYQEIYKKEDVNQDMFNHYMLNMFSEFSNKMKEHLNESMMDEEYSYYPCKKAIINGVNGYIIESTAQYSRSNLVYLLSRINTKDIFCLRHNDEVMSPSVLEKNAFTFRWGWFISPSGKSPLSNKKKGERHSLELTKKNFKVLPNTETNAITLLREILNDDEQDSSDD